MGQETHPHLLLAGCQGGKGCGTRRALVQAPLKLSLLPSVQEKDLKASLIINRFALFSFSA